MKKKLVAALLAGIMLMGMLAGCGSGEEKASGAEEKVVQGTEDSASEDAQEKSERIIPLKYNGKYYIIQGEKITVVGGDTFGGISGKDSINVGVFHDGYAMVQKTIVGENDKSEKRYIINTDGEIVVEEGEVCDNIICLFSDGYVAVEKNGENGIINVKGETIVGFGEYDFVNLTSVECLENGYYFDNGEVVAVNKDDEYGVISVTGEVVDEFGKYEFIYDFDENGLAVVEKDSKEGLINRNGEVVVELGYGVINTEGEIVVEVGTYDELELYEDFSDGYAIVYKDDKRYAIDTEGKVVADFDEYFEIKSYDKYVIAYVGGSYQDMKQYLISADSGEIVLDSSEYDLIGVSNGLVVMRKDEKYGVVNIEGEVVFAPKYERPFEFDAYGVAVVYNADGFGVINTDGEVVVECGKYLLEIEFSCGLAEVSDDYKNQGIINTEGEVVVELGKYDNIATLGGYVFAKENDEVYIINSKGEIIYQEAE